MKIKYNKIKCLKITLENYLKGLIVKENSLEFINEIQRITENCIIEYENYDIKHNSFLYWTSSKYINNYFKIIFISVEYKIEIIMSCKKNNNNLSFTNDVKIDIKKIKEGLDKI